MNSQHEVYVISGERDFELGGKEYSVEFKFILYAEMDGKMFFGIFLFDRHNTRSQKNREFSGWVDRNQHRNHIMPVLIEDSFTSNANSKQPIPERQNAFVFKAQSQQVFILGGIINGADEESDMMFVLLVSMIFLLRTETGRKENREQKGRIELNSCK